MNKEVEDGIKKLIADFKVPNLIIGKTDKDLKGDQMRKKITLKHLDSKVEFETEYDPEKHKGYFQRKGVIFASPEMVNTDDFWSLILSFASVSNITFSLGHHRFEIYIISQLLPEIPEGYVIPVYEITITDLKEAKHGREKREA